MKVTILGCGGSAGVPSIGGSEDPDQPAGKWGACDPYEIRNRRTRSSIVIEQAGFRLLVDSGPDLRQQLLANHLARVDALIFTHGHSDHIAGLDEVRAINRVIRKPLPLLATEDVLQELQARFSYAFRPWEGGQFYRAAFDVQPIPEAGNIQIGPLHGSVFPQTHGLIESRGMRFGDFAYSTDVAELPAPSLEMLKGVKTWVVGCFQPEQHFSHGWLARVLEWREIVQPQRLVLTHMGPAMDYATLKRTLPTGVEPAFDGMTLEISSS
ncbi:MBL fold metallo-hydrolase [Oecophyllibacter saccharovorans]|uniref:MBL fold metallo-hydrolase n=1 Tax=Oecophyllibacter saccharovorans TaxID=2558360 RepID=A0A506URL3_9PROT|nr:MBL fold metallo-hydrolase [Oecophyllibacter saccharovorans]TPW35723.1 MBL fold metallo-hydrolase [Oecophyllibacter saccharovorans]